MSTIATRADLYCCLVASTQNSTLSRLWLQTTFQDSSKSTNGICWILEDGIRDIKPDGSGKIYGQTAIGEGSYPVVPIFAPSKFALLGKKYFGHDWAIGLEEVPHFEQIRCHWGIKVDDSLGCPLTGLDTFYDDATKNFTLGRSRDAYATRLYPRLAPHYDKSTKKFRIPVWWHTLRKNILDVNLLAKEAWT